MVGKLKPVSLAMHSPTLSKRTRVVTTILGITTISTTVILFLARIASSGGESSMLPNMLSTASAHTTASTSTTRSRPHRVLAYGDSLTAGTSGMNLFPYAPFLEKAILANSATANVVVRHRGMPGWTTQNMLDDLDGPRTGLRSAIQSIQDPPLSLVIVLAGTNDIGHGQTPEVIYDNLVELHQLCHKIGVPKTIAVGIPPSGYTSQNAAARSVRETVNSNLQAFAEKSAGATTFVPFPFDFVRGGDNWYADTLHFSQPGYKVLGESLAPAVQQALESLGEKDNADAPRL